MGFIAQVIGAIVKEILRLLGLVGNTSPNQVKAATFGRVTDTYKTCKTKFADGLENGLPVEEKKKDEEEELPGFGRYVNS